MSAFPGFPDQGLATLWYQPIEEVMTLVCQRMEEQLNDLTWLGMPKVRIHGTYAPSTLAS